MLNLESYPEFLTFQDLGRKPTSVDLYFEKKIQIEDGKYFYPKNISIERHFLDEHQSLKFGACQFAGFLHDTIHVEHNIVIPSIRDLEKLDVAIPDGPKEELYKLVTDEGHHAAQALTLINAIKHEFDIDIYEKGKETPLFIVRLNESMNKLSCEDERVLFRVIIGIVTETRISKELGQFVDNDCIQKCVVDNCRSHQEDETVHASQFRALGIWMWDRLSAKQRELAAGIYAETTVMRSLPDVERLAFYFSQASGHSKETSLEIVRDIFREDVVKEEMLIAARPTIAYLKKLGVTEYSSAKRIFDEYGITV